jgi:hypothetical protein
MVFRYIFLGLWLVLMLGGCREDETGVVTPAAMTGKHADTAQLAALLPLESGTALIPELSAYRQRVKAALQADPPVLLLPETELSDPQARAAQQLAIRHPQFKQRAYHPQTRAPLRNEIMSVRPALPADFSAETGPCKQAECYRIEMYSHFFNASTIAFVDVDSGRLLGLTQQSYAQPDLPDYLIRLAQKIAAAAPEVKAILAADGRSVSAGKAEFKTALKDSRCERSRHLCVAPTYVFEEDALWAIVDLTEGRLVGTRWTELGSSGPPVVITERSLENEVTFRNFCEKVNPLTRDDWSMDYVITGSDGLQLTGVRYKDRPVLKNVKLLDWHVSYSSRDGFGYSDAIGCPLFSSAVVIAYNGPQTEPIMQDGQEVGFAVVQDFRQPPWPTPCNYRYVQRFEFYRDGRFRIAQADLGRGCGTDGTYRPVVRIDLDAGAEAAANTVAEWNGQGWDDWTEEQWRLQDDAQLTPEGYQYKVTDDNGQGFYIEPGQGQFADGGRGDHAYSYFSVYKPEEGEQDTVTIGSCCNTDHRQGPEQFIEPAEKLAGQDLVMWYVPQMKNDGQPGREYCWADTRVKEGVQDIQVWPCWSGPMFVPVQAH